MTKFAIVVPLIAVGLAASSCTISKPDPTLPEGTEIWVSAAVQVDIEGLTAVSLTLTPAPTCEGYWDDAEEEGITPWTVVRDIDQLMWPNGKPIAEGPNEYDYALAENSFIDVVPGCYDVVARPLGADDEPILSCVGPSVTVEIPAHGSMVAAPPIVCSQVPRPELDVLKENFPPNILELTVEPMVSACDAAMVCATARDADADMLEFEWPQPLGIDQGSTYTAPWPTIVHHSLNDDDSVTQCIAVQAHEPGVYDITVNVYDVTRLTPYDPPIHSEDLTGTPSSATETTQLDATLGCEPTGRSAVILLTLDNDPGLADADAGTLISNTAAWVGEELDASSSVLVVLDDNHHGEDWQDGEFVREKLQDAGYATDYMVEPTAGLDFNELEAYDVVWFVNPGYEMDDAVTQTALLRYRQLGGGLILQGDDISRFRANPQFMEPLTYLSYQGNGTVACGDHIDNNLGEAYTVEFELDSTGPIHPMIAGLEGQSFEYGNDIDLTRPLGKGEEVLAWASYETEDCVVRTAAVVALEPEMLLPW